MEHVSRNRTCSIGKLRTHNKNMWSPNRRRPRVRHPNSTRVMSGWPFHHQNICISQSQCISSTLYTDSVYTWNAMTTFRIPVNQTVKTISLVDRINLFGGTSSEFFLDVLRSGNISNQIILLHFFCISHIFLIVLYFRLTSNIFISAM